MELIILFEKKVVARSCTADDNLQQSTEGVNRTPSHVTFFSCLRACVMMSHTTLAQGVCARHLIHVSCDCVFDLSSTLSSHFLCVSSIFSFILPIFHFLFCVDVAGARSPVHFARRRSLTLWSTTPLSQVNPNYVIKKGRPHDNRHEKTEAQKEHFIAHNLRKTCINKEFKRIHDRIQMRNSKLIGLRRSAS